jgi:hypothetical protein
MIAINNKSPVSIHFGNLNISKVFVGATQVWPDKFTVTPEVLWLTNELLNSSDVTVDTNLSWKININELNYISTWQN